MSRADQNGETQVGRHHGSKPADRAIDLLGLARRAGKLTLGAGATESAFERGAVCALVLARDTARGSAAKVAALARVKRVPCYFFGSKAEFGRRFGRLEVAIVGVLDHSFAAALAEHFGQPTPDHGNAAEDGR